MPPSLLWALQRVWSLWNRCGDGFCWPGTRAPGAESCQGLFTASQAPNPGRKVGMELLGMTAPVPGVLRNRAGSQRCDLGGRDPVLGVGFLAGDRGWQLGKSCALLSLSWQAWQRLPGISSRLERKACCPARGWGVCWHPRCGAGVQGKQEITLGWVLHLQAAGGEDIPWSRFRGLAGHGMAGSRE